MSANTIRSFWLPVYLLVAVLASPLSLEAQGFIPNETCSGPPVVSFPGCDSGVEVRDAGAGKTVVTTFGSAELLIPMPLVADGMQGVARLYHSMLKVNVSYPAWQDDPTGQILFGGGIPVPNVEAANLDEGGAYAVQPRPGTMPGLYLYFDNTTEWFYQYGSPIECGANPQTTAIYKLIEGSGGGGMFVPASLGRATTLKYASNLSGAQLWHYTSASTPYIEVKHVDGSIARFESFDPYLASYTPSGQLWHLVSVKDPYDNTATYVWSGKKLTRIDFPSGLKQHFDYTPEWDWGGGSYDCLEISYEQGTTNLTARTWGLVFTGALGTSSGRHFGKRLYRTYSAKRDVLVDPTAGTPHSIGTGSTAFGQIVHEFVYDQTNALLKEDQAVHGGTAFDATLSTTSDLQTRHIYQTSFVTSSSYPGGRVASQARPFLLDGVTCSYPTSDFRTNDLLSGASLAGIEVTDASGTKRRFEYDENTGQLYRTVTRPSIDADGMPRDHDSSNSTIGGAAGDVEPDDITVDNVFDGMCVCQKPIEVRVASSLDPNPRVTNFEYYADSHLLKKRSEPNPETGSGVPAQVHWEYTYVRAMASGQDWGAWLIESETTPDGVYIYSHGDLLNRADATNHGQIAGTVQRSLAGVRIQGSLSGGTSASSVAVVETLHRNLPNNPGGLSQSGSIEGLPRRAIDGDGVSTTFEYSTQGWMTAVDGQGGATRTTWSHNSYGDVSGVTENANSTAHVAATTYTVMTGVGVAAGSSTSSGGLTRATQTYFDRWGHVAVSRHNNLASNGSPPTNAAGSSTTARAWVEEQYHYKQTRLVDTFRDRERLDVPAGSGQFLHTAHVYSTNGRLDHVVNPNGSKTYFVFDGYGTLYRSYITNSAGSETVNQPKRFVNPFLEVTGSYEYTGSDHLWTLISRNSAGAITQITEPQTTAPAGYTTPAGGGSFSTGGARHVFSLDKLGRVTRTETFEGSGTSAMLLAMREMRYDQMSRQIWQHDQARLRDINATGTSSTGDHYVAWKYQAGKASQLDTVEKTGIAAMTYSYSAAGFLQGLTDGGGNTVAYAYHGNTPYPSMVTRTDVDPAGGSRVSVTSYGADAFGRTTSISEGASAPLVHSYAYDSLGHVDQYTDPAGKVQKFLPDAMGRIVEHVRFGAGTDKILNTSTFDDLIASTKVTRADGSNNVTVTHFDFAGRPFIVQNPGGDTAPSPSGKNQPMCLYAEYDGASRIQFVYQGDAGKTEYFRDGMGRVIQQQVAPLSGSLDFAYAPYNTRDVFRRDAIGRIAQVDYWAFADYSLLWAVGNSVQDSIGRTHNERFFFASAPGNALDIVSTYSSGQTDRSDLIYQDNLGSGGASSSSEVLSLQFGHDAVGRLEGIDWDKAGTSTGMEALATYEWVGGLRRYRHVHYKDATNPRGFTTYSYDAYGRGTQIKDDVTSWDAGASTWTVATASQFDYEYDAAGNLLKEHYAKVKDFASEVSVGDRFAYDAYHRLTHAWMGVNSTTMAATADPTGFSSSAMHEQLTYGLDKANNRGTLASVTAAGTASTDYKVQDSTHAQGPSNRYDIIDAGTGGVTQEYDKRGNLTYDGTFYYRYDYRNRLQEVYRIEVSESLSMESLTASSSTTVGGSEEPAPQTEGRERYAVLNPEGLKQAVEEIYQDVPNLVGRAVRESMDPTFRSRLRAPLPGGVVRVGPAVRTGGGMFGPIVESATVVLTQVYIYDSFNRRTITIPFEALETAQFHTYDGWRQVGQYGLGLDGSTFIAVPSKQFVWGSQLDELVAYRRLSGTTWENYYVLHGGQDTAVKLVDQDGNVVEQYEYDPYGKVTVYDGSGNLVDLGDTGASPEDGQWSALGLPFLWKGVRLDHETGLLYMRNRYYSAAMGRFLTVDPIGNWGDLVNQGNGYAYVENSPMAWGDPYGLATGGVDCCKELRDKVAKLTKEVGQAGAAVTSQEGAIAAIEQTIANLNASIEREQRNLSNNIEGWAENDPRRNSHREKLASKFGALRNAQETLKTADAALGRGKAKLAKLEGELVAASAELAACEAAEKAAKSFRAGLGRFGRGCAKWGGRIVKPLIVVSVIDSICSGDPEQIVDDMCDMVPVSGMGTKAARWARQQ